MDSKNLNLLEIPMVRVTFFIKGGGSLEKGGVKKGVNTVDIYVSRFSCKTYK